MGLRGVQGVRSRAGLTGMIVDDEAEEKELVRKLVLTGHLNVPERKALPGRAARASLIRQVVEDALRSGQPFRAWWLPDDSMIGCEIVYRGGGAGLVCGTYSGIEGESSGVRDFGSLAEAAAALIREARPFFGEGIDGVTIDWTA